LTPDAAATAVAPSAAEAFMKVRRDSAFCLMFIVFLPVRSDNDRQQQAAAKRERDACRQ
jgi:hypothetical protein